MSLPSLLFYLGVLLVASPSTHAQPEPRPDILAVSAEAPPSLPSLTSPTRRCRDAIDRRAGERPVAQARCGGAFGLPAVETGRRIDPSAGSGQAAEAALHVRLQAALDARLGQRRVGD